jgi:hypothetical protein
MELPAKINLYLRLLRDAKRLFTIGVSAEALSSRQEALRKVNVIDRTV